MSAASASTLLSTSRHLEILTNTRAICQELLDEKPSEITVLAIVDAENSLDLCGSTLKQLRYELASVNSDEIGRIKIVAFSSMQVLGELAVWLEKATHDADVSDLQTKVKYSLDLLNNILWDLKIQMEFENIDVESLADTFIVDDSDETQTLADTVILDGTEDWSSDE